MESPPPAAGGAVRASKKARIPYSKESREVSGFEGLATIVESIEKFIVDARADRLALAEVMKELICELRKAH